MGRFVLYLGVLFPNSVVKMPQCFAGFQHTRVSPYHTMLQCNEYPCLNHRMQIPKTGKCGGPNATLKSNVVSRVLVQCSKCQEMRAAKEIR